MKNQNQFGKDRPVRTHASQKAKSRIDTIRPSRHARLLKDLVAIGSVDAKTRRKKLAWIEANATPDELRVFDLAITSIANLARSNQRRVRMAAS